MSVRRGRPSPGRPTPADPATAATVTAHPIGPAPAPPARVRTGHLVLRAWCVAVLVFAIGGPSWVNAVGAVPAAVVTIATGVVTAIVWAVVRPSLQWRRLPWYALAYVAWALASLAWSAWPATSALTLLLLVITTLQGLFLGVALGWHDLVGALAAALKWIVGLCLAFELWVSLVWQGPILPQFVRGPADDPIAYWSRDNLFDGGRIQGIFGNANLFGPVMLLALVVFGIRFADRRTGRIALGVWMALAAFLLVRTGSATTAVTAVAVAVVLGAILLMRTTRRPGERTRWYLLYALVAGGGALAVWLGRGPLLGLLGRQADLTGRERIWEQVLERADQRPVVGWGFATPWLTWDPAFDGWIVDHGQSVMQAHDVWVDVRMQLGWIGVALLGLAYLALVWRAWFFAVDRPRWDLQADRPYSAITLLPSLVVTILLVQGLAESGPLLTWGWLSLVMLGGKIKQSPLVGVGPAEDRAAIERGDAPLRVTAA